MPTREVCDVDPDSPLNNLALPLSWPAQGLGHLPRKQRDAPGTFPLPALI